MEAWCVGIAGRNSCWRWGRPRGPTPRGLLFVSSSAARGLGPDRVDRAVALLDVDNLSFLIDHERRAISDSRGFDQDPVRLGNFALRKVAQHRDLDVVFRGELAL